jgi:hypothetical protein
VSKKITLLALAVSFAIFILPAMASATEIHFEGPTNFTGEGPAGELRASGEPTFTCEKIDVQNGVINSGGTTGSMDLDLTGCHINLLGFTVKCRTVGSALDNTIKTSATVHLITTEVSQPNAPSFLVTLSTTTIICAGSELVYHGDIIGTITGPKCGESSTTIKVAFGASGSSQDHTAYTGKTYDLTCTTGASSSTAALVGSVTLTTGAAGNLGCT